MLRLPPPPEPYPDLVRGSDVEEMRREDMVEGERSLEKAAALHALTYRVCIKGRDTNEQVQEGWREGRVHTGKACRHTAAMHDVMAPC